MGFDPDAYLAKKKAGGFDPDAYLSAKAAPAARTVDGVPVKVIDGVPTIDNGPPELSPELSAKIRAGLFPVDGMTPEQTYQNAIGTSRARITPTVNPWVSAAGGAVQGVSQGFGDEIAAASQAALGHAGNLIGLPPKEQKSYRQWRDEYRRDLKYSADANPFAAAAGEMAGGIASTAIPGLGLAKGATFGEMALQAAKQGALYGLGDSEADITRGDIGGAAKDATLSGLAGVGMGALAHGAVKGVPWLAKGLGHIGFEAGAEAAGGAEGRVQGRLFRDIVGGGEGAETTAKASVMRTLEKRAGSEGEELAKAAEETGLTRTLATKAMSAPGSAAKKVGKAIATMGDRMDAIYEDVGKGPISSVIKEMTGLQDNLLAQGYVKEADVLERYAAPYVKKLATDPNATIEASALRNMRREIGQEAFRADRGAPTISTRAKRDIYGAFSNVIEEWAANKPGVDVSELKDLNRRMSILIPARDALEERAAKEHAHRYSLPHLLQHGVGGLAGAYMGFEGLGGGEGEGLKGGVGGALAGGFALAGGKRVAGVMARNMDYALARLVKGAAEGKTAHQIADMAIRLGIPVAVGHQIAKRLGRQPTPGEETPIDPGALPTEGIGEAPTAPVERD